MKAIIRSYNAEEDVPAYYSNFENEIARLSEENINLRKELKVSRIGQLNASLYNKDGMHFSHGSSVLAMTQSEFFVESLKSDYNRSANASRVMLLLKREAKENHILRKENEVSE